MDPLKFDFVVIGGGSAGYAAASKARAYNKSVAIIDNSETLGGLCILRGCMPSKTLIYSAEILHNAQRGNEFGLTIPEARADTGWLVARKRKIISEFANYRQGQLQRDDLALFRNSAKFINQNTLELDDGKLIGADKFLISTGSKIAAPSVKGLDKIKYYTSDDILDMDDVPESMIVLGGGIVACELGQYLNRIGCKVTQIQRSPHILKEGSIEAAQVVESVFLREGIELITDTQIEEIGKEGKEYFVKFKHRGKTVTKKARGVFNALGRKPNTGELGLEKAGVNVKETSHVEVNQVCQTTNQNIYAAGDCAGPHEIVHVAILQGECAVDHAFGGKANPINYDHLLKVIFTDPQVAFVGLSQKEINEAGIEYMCDDYPFDDHGKSILMEAKDGYVKVIADKKNGKVLGAECVGKDASELIHPMSLAISLGATVFDLLKTHWYHPTLSEIWTYPLETIAERIEK